MPAVPRVQTGAKQTGDLVMPSLEEGRTIVNWKQADWQPYPATDGVAEGFFWHPIRPLGDGAGFYLMQVAPGSSSRAHCHSALEAVVVLAGEVVDSDGAVHREGDCIAYAAGSHHRTHSPKGATMLVWTAGPIEMLDDDTGVADIAAGRRVKNRHEAVYSRYPSLPATADPIDWSDVAGEPESGEGFYLVQFPPGASSAEHEHMGPEHFIVFEGELVDPDGSVYRSGDCVALEPGTVHGSHSPAGCFTAAFIGGRLRTIG